VRKAKGPRARWALAAALLVAMANTSNALGMARSTRASFAGEEGQGPALTLGANVDRSTVAPYRGLARTSAIAAAVARAHLAPVKVQPVRQPVQHVARPRPVVRYHLWIPSLGISRSYTWYRCGRDTPLANAVYRWACAGRNNVYLMGHAWGVFKALHDAYVNGTLRRGIVAYWADSVGRVHRFRVTAWQVVVPSNTRWATASQPTLSMTLQTCMGSRSQYRLDVRLVSFWRTWAARRGPQPLRSPRTFRAMTSRWTWLVPSPISVSFASRRKRSTGYSVT
jgi:hypothetical protein